MEKGKPYEILYEEAEGKIPLYTKEWTNFNRSDPGVTILQNFTAYAWLERQSMKEAAAAARPQLLALAGFKKRRTACSRVYLKACVPGKLKLPSHKKMVCGDLCFETEKPVTLWNTKIVNIYQENQEGIHKTEYLPDGGIPLPTAVFGEKPRPGAALYLTLSELPPSGEELLLYAQVEEAKDRKPFEEGHIPPFADLEWECLTGDGFTHMKSVDGTASFLKSGPVALTIPGHPRLLKDGGEPVCVLRCILKKEQYDQIPRLLSLGCGVFPAVQRNTQAVVLKAGGASEAVFESEMTDFGYWFFLVREKPGGPYYRYEPSDGKEPGRYYRILLQEPGFLSVRFAPETFGYGPASGPENVLLICYTEETAGKRRLGRLYGCVEQKIELSVFPEAQKEGFALLAEGKGADGTPVYMEAQPEDESPERFYYQLEPEKNRLVIFDAKAAQGWKLFLAGCFGTKGAGGNIKENSRFHILHPQTEQEKKLTFLNPGPGCGGVSTESEEEENVRFAGELLKTRAAVRDEDYEQLVLDTPGLRIEKTGAEYDPALNRVRITVLPGSEQPFPRLPDLYRREILSRLSARRLLCTQTELLSPVYVPIHVQGTICVRAGFEGSEEQIRELLRHELDYREEGRRFEEILKFHSIVEKLEGLECVAYVREFTMRPSPAPGALAEDGAIRLACFCLPCPGEFSLHLTFR